MNDIKSEKLFKLTKSSCLNESVPDVGTMRAAIERPEQYFCQNPYLRVEITLLFL